MFSFTFGSDPEFMLQTPARKFVSAIGIVPGDKYKRHKIGRHEYYYDNVMAECAVAPAATKKEVIENFRDCFGKFAELTAPMILVPQASADYPEMELLHEDAKAIGCDPEYCVYDLTDAVPPVQAFKDNTLRTAGGHIHLGCETAQSEFGSIFTIRMLDLFLGVPSIFMDHDKTAKRRKQLYGKAGRWRNPSHGVEYRSLSNFWLQCPKYVELIYDICEFVLEFVDQRKYLDFWTVDFDRLASDDAWNEPDFNPAHCYHCHGYDVVALRDAIDTMDKRKGKKFFNMCEELMPALIWDRVVQMSTYNLESFYTAWQIRR
jgi:hypothetical protein